MASTRREVALIAGARLLGSDELVDVALSGGTIAGIAAASAGFAGLSDGWRPTRVVQAAGRFLTSGLWDEHVHFNQWAEQQSRLDLGEANSAAAALELIAAASAASAGPAPAELVAVRARPGAWADSLDRERIDAAAGGAPVVVIGVDLHSVWLSSAAMRARGLDPAGDGRLVEDDCFALLRQLDQRTPAELDALVDAAGRAAAQRGVVGIVDLEMRWCIDDWLRRERAGFRWLRVDAGIYPDRLEHAVALGHRSGDPLGETGRLRVGPFKLITDGSLGTATAWCCEPYASGGTGRSLISADDLTATMRRASGAGLDLAIHAIGDRAAAQVLDAFAALGTGGRMEHAQLLRLEDVARFAELGVVASVQPTHLVDDRELTEREWPGHGHRAFPLASLAAAGAQLVFGSDAPVAPLDPWQGIAAAVNRAAAGDEPWTAAERLPGRLALESSMRGRLVPRAGDPADLVLLDTDPLSVPTDTLAHTAVAATMIAGELTYDGL